MVASILVPNSIKKGGQLKCGFSPLTEDFVDVAAPEPTKVLSWGVGVRQHYVLVVTEIQICGRGRKCTQRWVQPPQIAQESRRRAAGKEFESDVTGCFAVASKEDWARRYSQRGWVLTSQIERR
jgi:hypothetical protein